MATPVRRKFMDSNRAQWFGILDGLINIGPAQLAGKFKETSLIGGGMIAQTARECHHPRIPLNGENIPGALHLQWPWIDAHGLPVARSIVWTLIDAGRIADVNLDERFFNGRIIQCSQRKSSVGLISRAPSSSSAAERSGKSSQMISAPLHIRRWTCLPWGTPLRASAFVGS